MTSIFPHDTVRDVAESLGIMNLKPDVVAAVALDVDYRIQLVAQECVKFMRHAKRSRLTATDVNNALRVQNIEPLYGYSSSREISFKKTAAMGQDLFYIDDQELDFDRVINMPLPNVPLDISYTAHWLAIDGVQPAIPQNPSMFECKVQRSQKAPSGPLLSSQNGVEVKPLVKHVLSKELTLYYDRISSAILSSDEKFRNAALSSLRHDPGLHELTPYFTQFIYINISQNLSNIALLERVLDMIDAILANHSLFVDLYLHQLMPAILTCMIGKKIGEDPTEDHWNVRDTAADLMSLICHRFSSSYHTLKPRVTKTLLKAFLDPQKPLPSHYGAIIGLAGVGPEVIRGILIPNLLPFSRLLEREKDASQIRQMEVSRCQNAIMLSLKTLIKHENIDDFATEFKLSESDLQSSLSSKCGKLFADLIMNDRNASSLVRLFMDPVYE